MTEETVNPINPAASFKPLTYISEAWLVIVLALAFGGALAAVHQTLAPIIAENKRNETYNEIPKLVPGAVKEETIELVVAGADGKQVQVYRAMNTDGTHLGWVVPAAGQGFADRIELLIGVDADVQTITGLFVLDQKETPGLGDFITDEGRFRGQFAGRPVDPPLEVVTETPAADHQIRALTGATISSESVSDIVNSAVANLRDVLRGERSGERSR